MQNPLGEVVSMPIPQGLPVTTSFHDNQHQTITMDTTASIATVSVTTQIEEAHSTTNNVNVCQTGQTGEHVEHGEGDRDKKAIYRHPLFPLMALLLEKCEQATQTPDCPSSDSFDVDIQAFVHRQEQERRPFFSDDLELDGLMVKAIQVLRIHLLELEKVSELCKDFCNRYISCLKGKLQSENLLRTDMPGFDSDGADDCLLSPGRTPSNNNNNNNIQLMQNSNVNLVIQGNVAQPSNPVPMGTLGQGQVVSGGTVYQMVQTPQGLVAQPIQIQSQGQTPTTPAIHGSTPLSQIGLQNTPGDVPSQHSPTTPSLPKDFNFDDDDYSKRKNKRGILPKQATQVMKSWLFQHIVHPYPTEDEKRHIAGQTNLTLLQVNNWFINARRRILQPMLDASNPEGPRVKKSKPQQNRPVQRFWPENLANLQPQSGNSASNQVPVSPSSSQSPTSTSSPHAKLQVVLEDEDDDDDDREMDEDEEEEDLEDTEDGKLSFSNGMMSSHTSTMGHQILLQSGGAVSGLVHNSQYLQPSSDVSSTSPSAATLNLIADVAMGGMQNTNFLPLLGTNQSYSGVITTMPSLRSDSGTSAGGASENHLKHDNLQLGVAEASSMMQ